MRQQQRVKGDDGFSLPEVLITVVMLGVIMTSIAGALLVVIGPDQQAADRLVASHDGQLLAVHLPPDLQSATQADTTPGPFACTGAVAGTNVLRLGWTQPEPGSTTYAVSYRIAQEAGEWRLIRFSCVNGGAVSRLVVAHDLANGSAAIADVSGSIIRFTVTERSPVTNPRVFTVSGSRRTPTSGG